MVAKYEYKGSVLVGQSSVHLPMTAGVVKARLDVLRAAAICAADVLKPLVGKANPVESGWVPVPVPVDRGTLMVFVTVNDVILEEGLVALATVRDKEVEFLFVVWFVGGFKAACICVDIE